MNPIFSLAALLRPDKPANHDNIAVILYIPIQFLGFTLGVLCQWWFDQYAGQIRFKLQPGTTDKYYWSECTWMELFACFVVVFVFLTQTGENTACSKDPAFQTFAYGITYGAYVIYSAFWPGGCLNPAYAFAQALWNLIHNKDNEDDESFKFFGNYIGCALAGMAIAVVIHWVVSIKAHDHAQKNDLEVIRD